MKAVSKLSLPFIISEASHYHTVSFLNISLLTTCQRHHSIQLGIIPKQHVFRDFELDNFLSICLELFLCLCYELRHSPA